MFMDLLKKLIFTHPVLCEQSPGVGDSGEIIYQSSYVVHNPYVLILGYFFPIYPHSLILK